MVPNKHYVLGRCLQPKSFRREGSLNTYDTSIVNVVHVQKMTLGKRLEKYGDVYDQMSKRDTWRARKLTNYCNLSKVYNHKPANYFAARKLLPAYTLCTSWHEAIFKPFAASTCIRV